MSDHFHIDFASVWKKYGLPTNQVFMLNRAQKLVYDKIREEQRMHQWTSIEGLDAGAKSLTDHAMGTLSVLRDATSSLESAIAGIAVGEPLETLLPTVRRLEMIADLIENLGTDLGNAADRLGDTVAKDIPGSA